MKPTAMRTRAAGGVHGDDVDRGMAKQQTGIQSRETRLDPIEVLDDERLQLCGVFDMELLDGQSHSSLLDCAAGSPGYLALPLLSKGGTKPDSDL